MKLMDETDLNRDEIEKQIKVQCQKLSDFLILKNREYGSASFKTGILGNYFRLRDKIDRYEQMCKKEIEKQQVNFEGIGDTIRDIAGYGIIGLIIYDNQEVEHE